MLTTSNPAAVNKSVQIKKNTPGNTVRDWQWPQELLLIQT